MSDETTTTPEAEPLPTWEPGSELPPLEVLPDRYLTVRYAGASGDFNPIHVDDEFAKQVGLPGRILHGLWTMAQVARAQTEAVGGTDAPGSLLALKVDFRGMAVPEQEIVVTSKVKAVEDDVATVAAVAKQGSARVIRNAEARVRFR